MRRLLLVEGMPGSGKTATVAAAAGWLSDHGRRVMALREGDPHPADLAWHWWLTAAEFEAACRDYPGAQTELRRWSWHSPSGVAVAYTKVDSSRCRGQWPDVETAFGQREPFEGRLRPERFLDVLAARWADFGAWAHSPQAPDVVVFDGSLLQNTLVELVLFGQWQAPELIAGLRRLAESVAAWQPLLVRLVPIDPQAALSAAEQERVDGDGRRYWREAAETYTANTPWARARGLSSPGALLPYLRYRQDIEAQVLPHLGVSWVDLPSPAGTPVPWTTADQRLREVLSALVE